MRAIAPTRRRLVAGLTVAAFGLLAATACARNSAGSSPNPAGPDGGATESVGETPLTGVTATPDGGQTQGPGGQGGGGTTPNPTTAPSNEDCVPYNAANLTVLAKDGAWQLRDDTHSLALFDTQSDANVGRAIARNWTQLCFIGRNNTHPERYRHMITYWRQPSGLPLGTAPIMECSTYDKTKLAIYAGSASGQPDWALHSGSTPLVYLATAADAQRAKLVAAANTKLCLIGHGNARPDPYHYVVEYWRP